MWVLTLETNSGKQYTLLFQGYFDVIEMRDTHHLYVSCGDDDRFSPEHSDAFPGFGDGNYEYLVWMVTQRGVNPMILLLTRRCRLTIDSILLPQSVYEDVPVSGRDIVITTSEFRLQCTFDGTPQETIEEIVERNPPLSSL
jgi:hypothetical protein